MNTRELWAQGLNVVGAIAVVLGAIDPLEGSIIILAGSAFMALAAFVSPAAGDRRYRSWVFALILIGVAALWGMSIGGGVGGNSGHSTWWALLVAPYLVGWVMAILGRDSPRWLLWAGGVVALWYLVIPELLLVRRGPRPPSLAPAFVVGAVGLVTLIGCYLRLRQRPRPSAPVREGVHRV